MGITMKKSDMIFKGVKLPPEVCKTLDRLLELQGLSFSEYTRNLIIKDLDNRNVFTTKLKVELAQEANS